MEKRKILYVEDDKSCSDILTLYLDPYFDIHTVSTKQEALIAIKKNIYDIYIIDVLLGKSISGIDIIYKIRKQFPGKGIIITTAFPSLIMDLLLKDKIYCLPKPFSLYSILSLIQTYFYPSEEIKQMLIRYENIIGHK